ncbi:exosome complex RNA-binding protein Rrp4 [Stetteria hydrogenophila]
MAGSLRRIVVPGEELDASVEGEEPYVVDVGGRKIATVMGILERKDQRIVYTPLEAIYIPKPGDVVIGIVSGIGVTNWFVDINSPYQAVLNIQDFLGRPFNPATDDPAKLLKVGDYVKAKVVAFDRSRNPLLTVQDGGLGRITEGKVVTISPAKVARVIGRRGSMINMIKEETGCNLFVAVNGRVHVKCKDERLEDIVVVAVKMIEKEAHKAGLTERIRRMIREERAARGV